MDGCPAETTSSALSHGAEILRNNSGEPGPRDAIESKEEDVGMFAVLKTGGKQYRVAKDDVVTIEKLEAEAGDTVEFDQVLMIVGDENKIGTPLVAGATVKGEVLEQMLGPKVISFKKRRRKSSSQRRRGHRQHLTRVRITDILGDNAKAAKAKAETKADAAAEAPANAVAEPAGADS